MTRVSLADSRYAERSLFRQLLVRFERKVVGNGKDWPATLEQEPESLKDLLLVDWDLPRSAPAAAVDEFRKLCLALVIVLFSLLDAGNQAALSVGAYVVTGKSKMKALVAQQSQANAERIWTCLHHQANQRI